MRDDTPLWWLEEVSCVAGVVWLRGTAIGGWHRVRRTTASTWASEVDSLWNELPGQRAGPF